MSLSRRMTTRRPAGRISLSLSAFIPSTIQRTYLPVLQPVQQAREQLQGQRRPVLRQRARQRGHQVARQVAELLVLGTGQAVREALAKRRRQGCVPEGVRL